MGIPAGKSPRWLCLLVLARFFHLPILGLGESAAQRLFCLIEYS
jgi:hypothetical protein